MIDIILSRTTVGHIFGANFWHMHLLYMIFHRKDRPETKTHNSWSHFWGKFRPMHLLYLISLHERMTWYRDTQRLVTFVGQILEHMRLLCGIAHDMIDMNVAHRLVTFLEREPHDQCTWRIDMRQRYTTVGHIFGPNFRQMHLIYMINIALEW